MTAYGRAEKEDALGHFSLTIQSVNRKFFDCQFAMPKELSLFEGEMRKWIASQIVRGSLTIQLDAAFSEQAPISLRPQIPLIKEYYKEWKSLAQTLDMPVEASTFWQILSQQEGIFLPETSSFYNENFRAILSELTEKALLNLLAMKTKEGEALAADLVKRAKKIEHCLDLVQQAVPEIKEKMQQRWQELVKTMPSPNPMSEEALAREMIVYAEKSDVEEELVRLRSHVQQFRDVLQEGRAGIGDRLDFLLQEMHREWTTIAAKVSDTRVCRTVIDAKVELKRMREQIQNVE